MGDRTCPRCGFVFDFPCRLKSHLKRKKSCVKAPEAPAVVVPAAPKKPFSCTYCTRGYNSRQGKYLHEKHCPLRAVAPPAAAALCALDGEETVAVSKGDMAMLFAKLNKMQDKIDGLAVDGAALVPAGEAPPAPAPTVVHSDSHDVHNTLINFQGPVALNFWGEEDLSWLDRPTIKALFDEAIEKCGSDGTAGGRWVYNEIVRLTISNPHRPFNWTGFLANKREGLAIVHRQEGWSSEPTIDGTFLPLSSRIFDKIFAYQPCGNARHYDPIIRELRDHEKDYHASKVVPTHLQNAKALLERTLRRLPRAGDPPTSEICALPPGQAAAPGLPPPPGPAAK